MHALIIGIDGRIGRALAAALVRAGHRVTGTSRRGDRAPAGAVPLDLARLDDPPALPAADAAFDVAFLCAAATRQAECRADPEGTARINAAAPVRLARHLRAAGSFVVFLSTSAVFDGTVPACPADRPVAPRTAYGRQKAAAEAGLLALGDGVAVLRLTKVLEPELPLLAGWTAALRRGAPVAPFHDMMLAPIAPSLAVAALEAIAAARAGGIFQVSATRDISYAEAAYHLAGRLGAPAGLVRPVGAGDQGIPAEERPRHTTLDGSRLAERFGLRAPDPAEALDLALAAWTRAGAP